MQSSRFDFSDLISGTEDVSDLISNLGKVAKNSVASLSPGKQVIAFSGGIDSVILAALSRASDERQISLLSLGTSDSKDLRDLMGRPITLNDFVPRVIEVGKDAVERATLKVSGMVEVETISHLEDCVAFYLIGEEARKLGSADFVASANGPDELFCGYDRFRRLVDTEGYASLDQEITEALRIAYNLKERVGKTLSPFGLRSQEPFLNQEFVRCAMNIPARFKILRGNDRLRKRIWRAYGRTLGLPDQIVLKEKKAIQYSTGIHKVVLPMVKKGRVTIRERGGTNLT